MQFCLRHSSKVAAARMAVCVQHAEKHRKVQVYRVRAKVAHGVACKQQQRYHGIAEENVFLPEDDRLIMQAENAAR